MNATELRVEMVRAGKSVEDVARELGVAPTTLYRKLDGKSDFGLNELKLIKNSLNLDDEAVKRIFFADELNKTQVADQN